MSHRIADCNHTPSNPRNHQIHTPLPPFFKMRIKLTSKIVATLATVGLSLVSQAASINGTITFSSGAGGGVIFQDSLGNITTNLAAAAGIQSWLLPEVDLRDGSFINVPRGQAVSFSQPWVFSPSAPTTPLWTITFGAGNFFTFNLSSSTVTRPIPGVLFISGTGTLTGRDGTNLDATPGTWNFATNGTAGAESKFNWSSSAEAVPEVGTSLLLSGALLCISFLRRRSLA